MTALSTHPLPTTMTVLRAHSRGGPEQLAFEEAPVPEPGPGEVLVAVHAAAITFDELRWDETWTHLPSTPSHEWSGVVAGLGADVADELGLAVGDAVFGLVPFDRDGAAAEYVVAPADRVVPKPRSLTFTEAAALPLAGLTARQAVVDHGGVVAGDRVLVLGAAGGVGAFAVQFALKRRARVTATALSRDIAFVAALGPELVYASDRLDQAPLDAASYDVVIDTVGGPVTWDAMALARPGGKYITLQVPPPAERLAELNLVGAFFIVEPTRDGLVQLGADVDAGHLQVTVAATYPLAVGRAAFQTGRNLNRPPGKTVLVVRGTAPTDPTEES
ncbi:NADP-dependent oxidoreductase [Cellulomonas sp. McL0617]|uniref:NADP-dependent oxidoreductase n=1 Tax=Cellulomonas sp. McL0617 TaxID=3415675 RepID=UPI003CFBA54B